MYPLGMQIGAGWVDFLCRFFEWHFRRARCPHRAVGVIGGNAPYAKNGREGGY